MADATLKKTVPANKKEAEQKKVTESKAKTKNKVSANTKERREVFKTALNNEIKQLTKVKKVREVYDRKELQTAFKKAAKSTKQYFVNKGK